MTISPEILDRKGARKIEQIPAEVLELLNQGKIETVNLTEWLAVDQLAVLKAVLQDLDRSEWFDLFEDKVKSQKKITANSNVRIIGSLWGQLMEKEEINASLSSHVSDVVRCWACWAIAEKFTGVEELMAEMKPFAADKHFGLREVVIFASKEKLIDDLPNAISYLSNWVNEEDENIRRFAVEVLRPIGVWTKKISALQEHPEMIRPLLSPLIQEPSRYVQNSVANWLNDASKSQSKWVESWCADWAEKSDHKSTQYMIMRGLRTLRK